MNEYHKIQSVYLRNPENNFKTFLEGQWALPEFEYLKDCDWRWTEKVDGTNIRVIYKPRNPDGGGTLQFKGKTDAAQIPPFLLEQLGQMFSTTQLNTVFPDFSAVKDNGGFPLPVTLYGEGYGARIQKGGGNYIPDGVDFILFDVKIGDLWLTDEDMRDIAVKLGIKAVPVIGHGTLLEAVWQVERGFWSFLAPGFGAEGLVCKPMVDLQDRRGHRVITKIKHKDFANAK